MNKEKIMALIRAKEEKKAGLVTRSNASTDVAELRSLHEQLNAINEDIRELRSMAEALPPEDTDVSQRTKAVNGDKNVPKTGAESEGDESRSKTFTPDVGFRSVEKVSLAGGEVAEKRARETRGKELKEGRSVTVASGNIIIPQHQGTVLNATFNQVSGLLDGVTPVMLNGGESYEEAYMKPYGDNADYTAEGADYTNVDNTYGYAKMSKTKVTAYSEISNEVRKLPAIDYESTVVTGIKDRMRMKLTRDILVGDGKEGHLTGIFSADATAISAASDKTMAKIDNTTLDEIIFSYGGDENVEDAATLILNKADLKAFSQLRTTDGKKYHTIIVRGNSGTIDGIPYIINSACKAVSATATAAGDYCMAYGPLSAYKLAVFSDTDIQRSTDYKFKQGMIANRGEVYVGGNVVKYNGFLRIKKAATA